MNDLNKAWRKRIEANMAKSGWTLDQCQEGINAVRVWFYSINLSTGPRVVGQISAEFYRDILNESGAIAYLSSTGVQPTELLGSALTDYDQKDESQRTNEMRGNLLAVLGNYARCTQTWGLLPPLSEVDGIHFGAVDWQTESGKIVFRPFAAFKDHPLAPQEIAELVSIQLSMHLARFPNEVPINV